MPGPEGHTPPGGDVGDVRPQQRARRAAAPAISQGWEAPAAPPPLESMLHPLPFDLAAIAAIANEVHATVARVAHGELLARRPENAAAIHDRMVAVQAAMNARLSEAGQRGTEEEAGACVVS